MNPENTTCQYHTEKINSLEVAAAKTETHLSHIAAQLEKLDRKLDRLDSKVEALAVGAATDRTMSSKSVDRDWKGYAFVAAISAIIAWGPKAAFTALSIMLGGK